MTLSDELVLATDRLRKARVAFYDTQQALERAWAELRDADDAFRRIASFAAPVTTTTEV